MQEITKLITSAQNGDLEAYDQLVRRFQDMAVAYGYSVLGDLHWAEDAAQEAFVEAFCCLPKLQEPLAFPGWLRRIVFKHCDRLTRKKQISTVSLDAALEEVCLDCEPHQVMEEHEAALQVRKAVAALPEHERSVTLLFYMGQHSQNHIAEFLEVPVTTVKKRLHTARKKLKEEMIKMVQDNLQEQRPSKDAQFAQRVKKTVADVDPATLRAFQDNIIGQKEQQARASMNTCRLSGQTQDVIITYLQEQEMARRPMLIAGGKLLNGLNDSNLTNNALRSLLEEYADARREYENRHQELEAALLARFEGVERLRVQAALVLLFSLDGASCEGRTFVSFDDVDYSPLLRD